MRHIFMSVLIIVFAGATLAADLGTVQTFDKGTAHVLQNQSSDNREGGNDMSAPVVIPALPFNATGATCDNTDDWDEECPFPGSTSPDVWFSFTPAADITINVDLESSAYDTKTYILDGINSLIACNDDYYGDYTSLIEAATLIGGVEYFIVIDGYGGDCGTYQLNIYEYLPPVPCIIECSGEPPYFLIEGEPDNGPGYVDNFNSGCNADSGAPFTELPPHLYGSLTVCGVSGWDGSGTRDTDWFTGNIGSAGWITWTVICEQESTFLLLAPQDCATVVVDESMYAAPCEPQTMEVYGTPGDRVWFWAGPSSYFPPDGFVGYNYNYQMNFWGLQIIPIATEATTFDKIKSMYR